MRFVVLAGLALAGCGPSHGALLRFAGEETDLAIDFDEQHVRPSSVVAIKQGGREVGPSGAMIAVERGDKVVLWCYHRDRTTDHAFTLALEVDALREGRWTFGPARAIFYWDRWTGREAAVQMEAHGGWLEIADVGAERVEARYEITLRGKRLMRDGNFVQTTARMRGRLSLRRN